MQFRLGLVFLLGRFCAAMPDCKDSIAWITDGLAANCPKRADCDENAKGNCVDGAPAWNATSCDTDDCKTFLLSITDDNLEETMDNCKLAPEVSTAGEGENVSNKTALFDTLIHTCEGAIKMLEELHECEEMCYSPRLPEGECPALYTYADSHPVADWVDGLNMCPPEEEHGEMIAEMGDLTFSLQWMIKHLGEVCDAQHYLDLPDPEPVPCYDHNTEMFVKIGQYDHTRRTCSDAIDLCQSLGEAGDIVREFCPITCNICHLLEPADHHDCPDLSRGELCIGEGNRSDDVCPVYVELTFWEEGIAENCNGYCGLFGYKCVEALRMDNDHCGSHLLEKKDCEHSMLEVAQGDNMEACVCQKLGSANAFVDNHMWWKMQFSTHMQVDMLKMELSQIANTCGADNNVGFTEVELTNCFDTHAFMTLFDNSCPDEMVYSAAGDKIYTPHSCGTSECSAIFQTLTDQKIHDLTVGLMSCEDDWMADIRIMGEQGTDMLKMSIFNKRAIQCGVEKVYSDAPLNSCAGALKIVDSVELTCTETRCGESTEACTKVFATLTDEVIDQLAEGLASCDDWHHHEERLLGEGGGDMMKIDFLKKHASACDVSVSYSEDWTPGTCAYAVTWKSYVETSCPERDDCFHAKKYMFDEGVVDHNYCIDGKPERSESSCGTKMECKEAFEALTDQVVEDILAGLLTCHGVHEGDWLHGAAAVGSGAFKVFTLEHIRHQCSFLPAGYTLPESAPSTCLGALSIMYEGIEEKCPHRTVCMQQGVDPRTCELAQLAYDQLSCGIPSCEHFFGGLTDQVAEDLIVGIQECPEELAAYASGWYWKSGADGMKKRWLQIGGECGIEPNISYGYPDECEGSFKVDLLMDIKCKKVPGCRYKYCPSDRTPDSCGTPECIEYFEYLTDQTIDDVMTGLRSCKGTTLEGTARGPLKSGPNAYKRKWSSIAGQCGVEYVFSEPKEEDDIPPCEDDDWKLKQDTGGALPSCKDSAAFCTDDSALRAAGAPEGWFLSLCKETCGVCPEQEEEEEGATTCGDIKNEYKKQGCCGNPNRVFTPPSRRLLTATANTEHQLFDELKATLAGADETKAKALANKLKAILEMY